ncbi:MAG: NADPH-dependent glutamate synthase [Lachnospiraceae bacterium]|jgi:glutamate synthase (NADPH/NADH) small chain|nr:NADPH-dependent glutamate synthase [Lachnospiraceae bacterium]
MDVLKKVPVREQNPKVRAANFQEVCLGYNQEEAMEEASRCLKCKNARCVSGCPVAIDIPAFIREVENGQFEEAAKVIARSSALPAVCGRVCPQESQCEGKCVRGLKGEPISIGKLERFVADWSRENGFVPEAPETGNGKRVAVIGSGPSGLTCAGDLAKMGYEVTIFEALHEPGGVLMYGIPEFRLPKDGVVKPEIENVKKLGVKIETNVIIGKSLTIDQLLEEEGFDAVFIGSGAGLPMFMGIPGENANGVFSANEYLTRSNLMKAFREDYDTPIAAGKKVAVVGGGNVAMDAARTALRLGAEVHIVYRRSEAELPARVEEVHHAKEEGIIFNLLTNPVEILTDETGWVKGMTCIRMELGEPDASGRRRPVPVEGSEFTIDVDTVIMSLGTSPNPLISSTTQGLETNRRKCIVAQEDNGKTSREGVYAGGDAVTGAATVILAMEAGRAGARGIDEYLRN